MDSQTEEKNQAAIIPVMTTEHYNLQSGRSMAISESMGRASLFLGTVSTTLVALALVGQVTKLGQDFFIFALVIFPALFFLGLVTFQRVLQISLEDVVYARGINRIRHLYMEILPQMQDYFVLSSSDDVDSVYGDMATQSIWWQVYLTTPGMIGVINSLLVASFLGLLASFFFQLSLGLSTVVGAVVFFLVLLAFYRYQWTTWGKAQAALVSRFPKGQRVIQRIIS